VVAGQKADRLHRPAVLALAGSARRERAQTAPAGVATAERGSELVAGRNQDRDHDEHGVGCCHRIHLYVVPLSRRPPVRLPVGRRISYEVAWSPRGDEIYYDSRGIWAIRPDGTGRRKISRLGWVEELSADGSQFAFGVTRYSSFGVVNADGTGYHVVTTHAYTEYGEKWSPLGHRILYGRADGQGIDVIGSDGRNNHRVTRDSPPQADWGSLAWSPDGGSIVYDAGGYRNTDLYVIGIDGRDQVQLTNTPDIDIDPSWVAR